MSLLSEFKTFAIRGNVVDMAIGVIMAAAFGKVVASLVNDVIMPPIGVLVGGVEFGNLAVTLKEAGGELPAVTLNYGQFIQTIVDFTIIAAAVFFAVKVINQLQKQQAAAPLPAPSREEQLLTEIRDLMKERR
ncbi:MAG: large-conductance mechanosensitive channel [Gammaproteobacteria bacterium RIFCSPLOWO2_02_FULL_61_13]|nr:MAG: large-conductance mechanosensitive channel [Gammaproteobacteria bacterium RIFCSPLOWO2_02_FULL_61_13]